MAKKNSTTQYTPSMSKNTDITLSLNKIISSVIGTLVVGAVIGGFTVVSLANSNAIRITAAEFTIIDIKDNMVSRAEWGQTNSRLDRMENKIDRLLER